MAADQCLEPLVCGTVWQWPAGAKDRHRRGGQEVAGALWRYLDRGEVPEGALLCDWWDKVSRKKVAAVAVGA